MSGNDIIGNELLLGKSGKGKELAFVYISDEEYTKFDKFCKIHHYEYHIRYKRKNVWLLNTEKRTWKEFKSVKHRFLSKLKNLKRRGGIYEH